MHPRVASTTYRAFILEIAETVASPYSLAWCCPAQWLEWIELVDLPKHGEPDLTKMFLVVPFSSISSTSSKCLQLSKLAGSQSHYIYTRRVIDQLEKLVWCNSSVRRFVRCIWVWLHHLTSFEALSSREFSHKLCISRWLNQRRGWCLNKLTQPAMQKWRLLNVQSRSVQIHPLPMRAFKSCRCSPAKDSANLFEASEDIKQTSSWWSHSRWIR